MLELLVLACLLAVAHSLQGADVVLSCSFIEEGGGMMGGSLFARTPATLVLRDLPMSSDLSPETITPYNPPDEPKADDLIFEVVVSSVEIPEAESLLHADCNEQEVVCELSRYVPRGTEPDALPAHFIGSIQIEGGGVGLTLVLQTISNEKAESSTPPLMQSKLQLPLSQWGTLLTDAVFVVFSRSPSLAAPIGVDARLDCGYRQKDASPEQSVGLEWRWQHKGNGRRILDMRTQGVETDGGTEVQVEREGVSADSTLLIRDGNASLTMKTLKVSDEGTYICTISSGAFQTQQIVQLQITQPPRVFLSEKKVVFQDESPQKLSCHCERYYPLDVHVEWLSQPPSETESISLTEKASLSSHRQHNDGTFSLSSFLFVRPSEHPPGTTFTCRVSHFALQTPSDVTLTVETPEPEGKYYWMVLATLVLSVLFLYQASR
ncbi:tapasin-related protein isoform X2 [Pygocentrus nattereri]|uniref:tapasin-related protein isoform X2 n=1 Tax=Pygocentrus nattereri TaxID=42514 RepID=UPI0018912839|nr:tapasin-related protein isoform X2 [Pygocentrus nattereri]